MAGLPGHSVAHSTSRRCTTAAGPPPPSHPARTVSPFPLSASILQEHFSLTLLSCLFNHPAHLAASRAPPQTNKQTRSTRTFPANTGAGLGGSSALPLCLHFRDRQEKSRGTGVSSGCGPWSGSRASSAGPAVLCGFVGRWLIAPVNHRAAPCSAVYFSDSNLVLALFHTCHRVFFLTLEACRKGTVINGAIHPGGGSFITL